MKKIFFLPVALLLLTVEGAGLSDAVALRCDFENALPDGVKAVGKYRTVPGLSGKGVRLNRNGWNGIKSLRTFPDGTAVALCTGLSTKRENFASFTASGNGQMVLTIRSGSKTEVRTVAVNTKEKKTFYAGFSVPEPLTTVIFKPENIKAEEHLVDAGWARRAFYTPVGKMTPGCYLEIDPAKGFLNLDKGAFALWIKTPYLNSKTVMDHIGIFGLDNAPKPVKRHPDQQIGCLTAWNGGAFNAYRISADPRKGTGLSFKLSELDQYPEMWHHILWNWERKGGNLKLELFIDGKLKVHSTKPYGPDKKLWRITVGYSDYAHLNGDADELMLFRRPLTKGEVKQLFEAKGNFK